MQSLKLLDEAANKRVLLCGEHIIDVYRYCKPLGGPTKDPIISVSITDKEERFDGGVIAAARHLDGFCDYDLWIGGHAVVKTRYVEGSHFHKLFQTYHTTRPGIRNPPTTIDHDILMLLDYGHGMFDTHTIDTIYDAPGFLCVNVQTNSGNYGFNLATKYKYGIDYLCLDEREARLATQNRDGTIEACFDDLLRIANRVVITRGKLGAVAAEHGGAIHYGGAFTDRVVDTMGAGDAFFVLTSLIAETADLPTLLQLGNAAGAAKSQIIGHRHAITKEDLVGTLGSVSG